MNRINKSNEQLQAELDELQFRYDSLSKSLDRSITENKMLAEQIRISDKYYSILTEKIKDVVWILDAETLYFKYVSPSVERLRGFTPAEIITKPMTDALTSEAAAYVIRETRKSIEDIRAGIKIPEFFTNEIEQPCKDGSTVWTEVITRYYLNPENNRVEVLGITRDISDRKKTEEKLKSSEQILKLLVQYAPAAIALFDKEMKYLAVSERFIKDYKISSHDILGRSHYDVFPEIPERWKEIHRKCLAGAIEKAEDDPFPREDGTIDWNRWEIHPWHDDRGDIGGILLFSEVITQRKLAEKAIAESEERLRNIIYDIPVGILLQGPQAEILLSNPKALELLGLSEDQLLGKTSYDPDWNVVHEDGSPFPGPTHPVPQAIIARKPVLGVVMGVYRPSTRNRVWLLVDAVPHLNSDGSVKNIVCSFTDITERKRIEKSLLESEGKFRKIYENGPFGMVMVNNEFRFISANAMFCRMLGYEEQEILAFTFKDITHPEDVNKDIENVIKLINKEIPIYKTEKRYIKKDGSAIWGSLTVNANYNNEGQFLYNLAIVEDITKRKLTESALIQSEENFSKAFRTSPAALIITRFSDGRFMEVNDEYCKIVGYERNELLGRLVTGFNIYRKPSNRQPLIDKMNADGNIRDMETSIFHRSGEIRYVIINLELITFNGEKCILTSLLDITNRKMAEKALLENQLQLKVQNEEYMAINAKLQEKNKEYIALTEEYITQNEELFKEKERAEESEAHLQEAQRISKMGNWRLDLLTTELICSAEVYNLFQLSLEADSSDLKNEIRKKLHNEDYTAMKEKLEEAIKAHSDFSFEFRAFVNAILRNFLLIAVPVNDSYNNLIGFKGTVQDITQQKALEQELIMAKEKAEESDRLKTAFLQNISHEIRTPMNAIMGFSELLTEQYNNKSKLEYYSGIINQRCNDLLDIINEILDVARIESGQIQLHNEVCDLKSLFEEISLFFKEYKEKQNKQHIDYKTMMDGRPDLAFTTDRVKLKQILINLIGNAFKFTSEGKIEAGYTIDSGNRLLFFVSDTGIGIAKEKHQIIFERFSQLEQPFGYSYGGTGLGLSIVKGLVKLLGGDIWVESEPGKGATFWFSLLYQESECSSPYIQPAHKTGIFNFSSKTLLIVEDDECNAEYLKEILEGTGIKIFHTCFGREAIQLAKTISPDVILMDIRLPDLDGYKVTEAIRKQMPDVVIITQTAFAAQEDKDKALLSGCNDYISKPVKKERLLNLIHSHLVAFQKG